MRLCRLQARADFPESVCDAGLRKSVWGLTFLFSNIHILLAQLIMGVNVSHPQRVKYVQANESEEVDGGQSNFDEREQFLSESSRVGGFEENIRDGKRLSKSNQTGFFHQFKSRKGKSKDTFDSLDTIDSRKSVPFAALPDTTRASTSSPSGDKEDLRSIFSDEVSTNVSSKNSRVLFTAELPTEDMDEDEVFTENSVEGFHEKANQNSDRIG